MSLGQAGSSAGSGHRPHTGGCKVGKLLSGAGTPCGARSGLLVCLCGIVSLCAGLVHTFLFLEAWREKELMGTRAREEDS